jgi:hypothetical protein
MPERSERTGEIEATKKVQLHASKRHVGQTQSMKAPRAMRDEHNKSPCVVTSGFDNWK